MKNLNIVPLVLLVLALAFVVISLAVYLSRGKNKYFLAKKLKLGAMIISLTAVTNGCRTPVVTCYKPAIIPEITSLQAYSYSNEIAINPDENELKFKTNNIYDSDLCYIISQSENITLKGDCVVVEGGEIDLLIKLEEYLLSGVYDLKIFYGKISATENLEYPLESFKIKVSENK